MNTSISRSVLFVFLLNIFHVSSAVKMSRCLEMVDKSDTLVNVWVVFNDKEPAPLNISDEAEERRNRAGYELDDDRETPVSKKYIEKITGSGGILRHIFKWANAASFTIHAGDLKPVSRLPFVKKIIPVSKFRNVSVKTGLFKEKIVTQDSAADLYGYAYEQLELMNVPESHNFIRSITDDSPGSGVRIGVFDNGFYLEHACFDSLVASGRVIADSDFVSNDSDPYYSYSVHGAKTMAQIAAYDPGRFIGTAWGAEFVLARTEEDGVERHIEEDNWAAAVVWAESLGVDIITSSVGYRSGFTDSLGNEQSSEDYTFEDMDGKTTIIALAAAEALERGVLVVNSMGNESDHTLDNYELGTIVSPADVEGVVSVGAVDFDLKIAGFSSTGPTAAGVKKPDCVAPGSGVYTPGSSGYIRGSGTSYSAPLVTGVLAMIRQVFGSYTPEQVRERLYSSCVFTPYQDSMDNIYGRGIPEAFMALYGDTANICVYITDYLLNGIDGADLKYKGEIVASTDNSGFALIDKNIMVFPAEIVVTGEEYLNDTLTIEMDSLFYSRKLSRRIVTVSIRSAGGTSNLKTGTVYYTALSGGDSDSSLIDSTGFCEIVRGLSADYSIYSASPGFYKSNTDTLELDDIRDTVVLTLRKRPLSKLVVYPTVVSAGKIKQGKDEKINIEFTVDEGSASSCFVQIAVRTLGGGIVWEYGREYKPGDPFVESGGRVVGWDCRGGDNNIVSPGVYIISIKCNDRTYIKKVLING